MEKNDISPEVHDYLDQEEETREKGSTHEDNLRDELIALVDEATAEAKRAGLDDASDQLRQWKIRASTDWKPNQLRYGIKKLKNSMKSWKQKKDIISGINESLQVSDKVGFLTKEVQPLFASFMDHSRTNIGFNRPPTINFIGDDENAANLLGKTAHYQPGTDSVTVFTTGRHPKDVLRSLSHELIHHMQNCQGRLYNVTTQEGYAQSDKYMRGLESEAFKEGNLNFRDWEDNYKRQNESNTKQGETLMSLNEWMNDERNILIRQKFGLPVSEELDAKADFKQHETADSCGEHNMVAEDDDSDEAGLGPDHPMAASEPEELEEVCVTDDEDEDKELKESTTLYADAINQVIDKIQKG